MASLDNYSLLEDSCRQSAEYPRNLTRSSLFRHALQSYRTELEARRSVLFEEHPEFPIDFLEAYDGEDFQDSECETAVALDRHLWSNRKDPRCRHV